MQAIPFALTALKSGGLSTILSVGGAAVSGITGLAESRYRAGVANNNAAIADQNAVLEKQKANQDSQQQDLEARAQIGQMLAEGGASGLGLGVGSMGLERKSADELAARDRGYTQYNGETRAAAYRQQSQDYRAEASSAKRAGLFGLATAGLGIGESLISGATSVNRRKAASVSSNNSRPSSSWWATS